MRTPKLFVIIFADLSICNILTFLGTFKSLLYDSYYLFMLQKLGNIYSKVCGKYVGLFWFLDDIVFKKIRVCLAWKCTCDVYIWTWNCFMCKWANTGTCKLLWIYYFFGPFGSCKPPSVHVGVVHVQVSDWLSAYRFSKVFWMFMNIVLIRISLNTLKSPYQPPWVSSFLRK